MKSLFTFCLVGGFAFASTAQNFLMPDVSERTVTSSLEIPEHLNATGGQPDTLGLDDFLGATPAVFQVATGYATGTLLSVDTFNVPPVGEVVATTQYHGFAEGYLINDEYNVTGAMFFAGTVTDVSVTDPSVSVTLYMIEDNQAISDPATVQNPDIPGPGTVLDEVDVPLSQIALDTSGVALLPTIVSFPNAPWVSLDIAVALHIEDMYTASPNDTVALVTTNDGEGDGEYTFHQVNQVIQGLGGASIWSPTDAVLAQPGGGGLDVNMGIFPIVQEAVGIEEAGFFDGLKMNIFPNPASVDQPLFLEYELENPADNVVIRIYSADGKTAAQFNETSRQAGLHRLSLDELTEAGSYICSIQAEGRRMAKRISLVK